MFQMETSPKGGRADLKDDEIARWGRSRNEGYRKFRHGFVQPAPMFFTQDHHPLQICDMYRGRSAFLICGGPSFSNIDRNVLASPGLLTMGVNNSPRTFRPNLWCSVDTPDHWIRSIWLDPGITKFVPICHAAKKIFNSDRWTYMDQRVGDCPNVVYYKRNEHFRAKQFLWEDTMNWGNHKDYGGGRSIMLVAIRILFLLGVRRVYLLGCDFMMNADSTYHFDQDRAKGAIKGNNETYQKLNGWFTELRPLFEQEGFEVFNCNEQSGLRSFKFITFADAFAEAFGHMDNVDLDNERTRGLYDTKSEDKEKGIGK